VSPNCASPCSWLKKQEAIISCTVQPFMQVDPWITVVLDRVLIQPSCRRLHPLHSAAVIGSQGLGTATASAMAGSNQATRRARPDLTQNALRLLARCSSRQSSLVVERGRAPRSLACFVTWGDDWMTVCAGVAGRELLVSSLCYQKLPSGLFVELGSLGESRARMRQRSRGIDVFLDDGE
jgi:hypothetical protein